jgi:hypothetical protein
MCADTEELLVNGLPRQTVYFYYYYHFIRVNSIQAFIYFPTLK